MSRDDSEFAVEVVRIRTIAPHPNADRLELAQFDRKDGPATYIVVVGKGEYKPGDLAVYVSVDAVVPLTGEQSERWKFLAERLDGKGKDKYRIRAARIRGVYSEGLLTTIGGLAFGDTGSKDPMSLLGTDCAEAMGIEYHNPEPASGPTPEGTRTGPVSRKPRLLRQISAMVPEYSLTSLRKVPNLFETGEHVSITEKIHGTNFRFGWIRPVGFPRSWQWVVASRSVIKTEHRNAWQRLVAFFSGQRPRHYYGEDVWQDAAEYHQLKDRAWDQRGTVFYGELFGVTHGGKKIQDLTYTGEKLGLRLFDSYFVEDRAWEGRQITTIRAVEMGVDMAPELYRGGYDEKLVRHLAEGYTTLQLGGCIREGVVVESLEPGERRKGKWVGEMYRMRKEG